LSHLFVQTCLRICCFPFRMCIPLRHIHHAFITPISQWPAALCCRPSKRNASDIAFPSPVEHLRSLCSPCPGQETGVCPKCIDMFFKVIWCSCRWVRYYALIKGKHFSQASYPHILQHIVYKHFVQWLMQDLSKQQMGTFYRSTSTRYYKGITSAQHNVWRQCTTTM